MWEGLWAALWEELRRTSTPRESGSHQREKGQVPTQGHPYLSADQFSTSKRSTTCSSTGLNTPWLQGSRCMSMTGGVPMGQPRAAIKPPGHLQCSELVLVPHGLRLAQVLQQLPQGCMDPALLLWREAECHALDSLDLGQHLIRK